MKPDCHVDLIQDGTNVGDMAHIIENKKGGDVSFENLLLLCKIYHKQVDENRQHYKVSLLREWKRNRNLEISLKFEKRYKTFGKLKEAVVPILNRQLQIFQSYGPTDANAAIPEVHKLWVKFEGELISNNRKLDLMLQSNKQLLHRDNKEIVDEFSSHVVEFESTRDDQPIVRKNLFPIGILSLFGIEHEQMGLPPEVSPLQNFIGRLQKEERFIDLKLFPEPILTFLEDGGGIELHLDDLPRVKQIFWSGGFYRPQTTKVRLNDLRFFLSWLTNNNITYEFKSFSRLTELILNGRHKVKVCYSYCLSVSDLHEIELEKGLSVLNLYKWNGGQISAEAHAYAKKVGVRLFVGNQFFVYAHRFIKE